MLAIVNFPAFSESTLLLFLSSGLVGLAQLVRRSLSCPLPKPQRLVVWIGQMPEEALGEDFAHIGGLSWTIHEATGPVRRHQERLDRTSRGGLGRSRYGNHSVRPQTPEDYSRSSESGSGKSYIRLHPLARQHS
jgi:hypothetical protein